MAAGTLLVVRRFEYIGGGSEKFWEAGSADASVTVHFGRIGTAGQTQVKDLGTEQAAAAHVAKLVAEVKKGYVESGSAAAPAPPAPPGAPPAAPAPAPDPDEETWTVPPAWLRYGEPFRGRAPARTVKVDPAAPRQVALLMERHAVPFARVLENPESDARLVERAAPPGHGRRATPPVAPGDQPTGRRGRRRGAHRHHRVAPSGTASAPDGALDRWADAHLRLLITAEQL